MRIYYERISTFLVELQLDVLEVLLVIVFYKIEIVQYYSKIN